MSLPGERSRGLGRAGWLLACFGALGLHAAAAATVLGVFTPENEEAALGAPAIEVGLELASAQVEQTDLPPGPVADDSAASPAMPEQRASAEQSALPKDIPTETEDPDRIVAPNSAEKPKEEEQTKATVTTTASVESVASEAAAPPAIENAPKAEQSVAPAQGTGESAQRIKLGWQKELLAHLNRNKRYPAGQPAKSAEIVLSFTLDRSGKVLAANVVKSSGDKAFDEAALAMMKRADPVPQPPPRVADDGLTFELPVIFRNKGRS